MIDIHCHLLPGMDDGAENLDEAVQLAQLLVADGITTVFATPHVASKRDIETIRRTEEECKSLRSVLLGKGVDINIIPGAENYPSTDLLKAIDDGEPVLLGTSGRYVLLDTPLTSMPLGLDDLIFRLQSKGITPILAHPERSRPIQEDVRILEPLVHQGLLLQVNSSCLVGRHGETAKELASELLRLNWVHFIASDAHSPTHRRPTMNAATAVCSGLVGSKYTLDLVRENGLKVLNGEEVLSQPDIYTVKPKPRLFSRIFGVLTSKD